MQTLGKHDRIIKINDTNLEFHSKQDYNSRLGQFFKHYGIKSLEEFIQIPSNELEQKFIDYAIHLKELCEAGELSPNTVPKKFRPMKYVLDVNGRENDIGWKRIRALWPKKVRLSGYKPYTTEQVQEIVEHAKNVRNKAFVHFLASLGARIGLHEHPLLMRHLREIEDCYGVLIYADKDEEIDEGEYAYWAFLTPEATKYLKRYFEQRRRDGEELNQDSPVFRTTYQHSQPNFHVKQLSRSGAISIMVRLLNATSINRIKKGRRFDTQLDHGFRKRFNTILKLNSEVNSNIAEKIMAHKRGLDGTYLKPTMMECFNEFKKAILELTVSDSERQKIKLKNQQIEITELSKKNEKISELEKTIEQVQTGLEALKKAKSVQKK